MNILQFEEQDCSNCYKCIRHCGVKAISYQANQVRIEQSSCILCGECVLVCPTHAKHLSNDFLYVKSLIENNDQVVVSLAPSYVAYFKDIPFSLLSKAMKSLGFDAVEETIIGARMVNQSYLEHIQRKQQKHWIATACYSTVLLIETYYPHLIPYLMPVDSPMIAHAKSIKQVNKQAKVVFVGPCVSKKAEAEQPLHHGLVDAVLTFEDVVLWMDEIGVKLESPDVNMVGATESSVRIYPREQGVIDSLVMMDADSGCLDDCHRISVSGLENCQALFDVLDDPALPSCFIEANVCKHGCLGGPAFRKEHLHPFFYRDQIQPQAQDGTIASSNLADVSLHRLFFAKPLQEKMPTETEIQAILHQTGKFSESDELNCGCCGYESCRLKAIAVYQNKADINMCLPYFKERAQSLSNMIIDHSPNAIFVLDEDGLVQEMNRSAELLFGLIKKTTLHTVIPMFLGDPMLDACKENKETIRKKLWYPLIERHCFVSATYLEEQRYYLIIIQDITKQEAQHATLQSMKEQTFEATSRVIEKQMRVAQEIASLLGETTAETKMTLTKLKRMINDEEFL